MSITHVKPLHSGHNKKDIMHCKFVFLLLLVFPYLLELHMHGGECTLQLSIAS